MILKGTELKPWLKGAIYWEGDVPYRFSPEQMEIYRTNESHSVRAGASAGMRLEMETDADHFALNCKLAPGSSQNIFAFDLFVNDWRFTHTGSTISSHPKFDFSFVLPVGVNRITCYFPCLAQAIPISLDLGNCKVLRQINHDRTFLFLGDSITQGYIGKYPSDTYPALFCRHWNADFYNGAIGGEFFHPETVLPEYPVHPEYIFVAYGTNDWVVKDRAHFISDATEYISRVYQYFPESQVRILTPVWRADKCKQADHEFHFDDTEDILTEICESFNTSRIKVYPGSFLFPMSKTYLCPDLLHPNDDGFRKFGQALIEMFEEEEPSLS